MLSLQKILVPIDASDNSLNALRFAKELAEMIRGEVTVIHVGPYHDTLDGVAFIDETEIRKKRLAYIKERIGTIYKEGVLPKIKYEVGFPVDVIELASKDADLIVLASSGEYDFIDRLLGSVSSGVAQNAHCPVLLIPEGTSSLNSLKVVFACQSENLDLQTIALFLRLSVKGSILDVDFVEVIKPGSKGVLQSKIEGEIKDLDLTDLKYTVCSIEGKSVVDSLNDYATEKGAGMIVMVTHHRNLIQSIFHQSQTKKMVMDLQHPLLVLHKDDK